MQPTAYEEEAAKKSNPLVGIGFIACYNKKVSAGHNDELKFLLTGRENNLVSLSKPTGIRITDMNTQLY